MQKFIYILNYCTDDILCFILYRVVHFEHFKHNFKFNHTVKKLK